MTDPQKEALMGPLHHGSLYASGAAIEKLPNAVLQAIQRQRYKIVRMAMAVLQSAEEFNPNIAWVFTYSLWDHKHYLYRYVPTQSFVSAIEQAPSSADARLLYRNARSWGKGQAVRNGLPEGERRTLIQNYESAIGARERAAAQAEARRRRRQRNTLLIAGAVLLLA